MQGFCHTLITKELILLAHSNTHNVHTFQVKFRWQTPNHVEG